MIKRQREARTREALEEAIGQALLTITAKARAGVVPALRLFPHPRKAELDESSIFEHAAVGGRGLHNMSSVLLQRYSGSTVYDPNKRDS